MNRRFAGVQGGLFAEVTKADVGEGAGRLIAEGYDVLAWADPFFPDPSLPASVREAMAAALADGRCTHYTPPVGALETRRAAARKFARTTGREIDPSREVLVTPGSDSGLLHAMLPFLDPGDEVLVPDPSYPSNAVNARLLGAVPVPVPLRAERGYQLDVADLAAAVTDRTRMLLLTHPNNPTGTVFRREVLEEVARFVVRHDLVLVCDQAFEDHVYDGLELVTPALLPGMWERTVTTFSVSKGLGLSGFRVGYLVACDEVMDVLHGAAVNVLGATNTLAQIGAVAALDDPELLPRHRAVLERRRAASHAAFAAVPGVRAALPESGILSWLDVRALGDAPTVAAHLLADARILVNEGDAYGSRGAGHLRVVHGCYADDARAGEVFGRLRDSLLRLAAAG